MEIDVHPEPDEAERLAILSALGSDGSGGRPAAYRSLWRASALSDLRDGALAEQTGGDPGVVEP